MSSCCKQNPCNRPGTGPCDKPYAPSTDGYLSMQAREPFVKKHVDGPLLVSSDGRLHWLTLGERFRLWLKLTDACRLNARYVRGSK